MGAEIYHDCCMGRKISRGIEEPEAGGGIIELDGNWILNHYGGEDTFLGRLALQPRFHRMELTDLNTDEANALGKNIQNIDLALRQYWAINFKFKDDLIERVYVVYFFESVYDKPEPTKFHLHVHLIPRAKSLDPLLREYCKPSSDNNCVSTINAWNIYKLSKHDKHKKLPSHYQIKKDNPESKQQVKALMTYLRGQLQRPS